MEEKTVKKVIIAYLKMQNQRFKLTKGAAPDILKDGIALEIKGSKFDKPPVLKQLIGYAFSYADLEIALPYDAITLDFIYALWCIECSIKSFALGRQRSISVYLVGEVSPPKAPPSLYSVYKFSSVKDILDEWNAEVTSSAYLPYGTNIDEAISKTSEIVSGLDDRMRLWLKTKYIEAGWTHKVSLQDGNDEKRGAQ